MSDPTPINSPIDEVFPLMVDALSSWKEANTPEQITKKVHETLEKGSQKILLSLLGFTQDSWDGRWRLDHCNGRNGASMAGDYLTTVQKAAIQEWLGQVKMPELSATLKKQVQSEMVAEYKQRLKAAVREIAIHVANSDAQELIENLTRTDIFTKYQQLQALINSQATD